MMTIREYKRAESLEEAWQLNQKKPNRVLGGMIWLKMETINVGTAIDLSGLGLDTIEETLFRFRDSMKESGFWYSRRRSQSLSWVQSLVHEALLTAFEQHPAVASRMPILENMVAGDKMDPVSAAHDLLSHFTYPAPGH